MGENLPAKTAGRLCIAEERPLREQVDVEVGLRQPALNERSLACLAGSEQEMTL